MSAKTYRTVPVRDLSSDELLELSKQQKLSLSREDMEVCLLYTSDAADAGDREQPVQDLHQEAFREDHGTQAGLRAQRV